MQKHLTTPRPRPEDMTTEEILARLGELLGMLAVRPAVKP